MQLVTNQTILLKNETGDDETRYFPYKSFFFGFAGTFIYLVQSGDEVSPTYKSLEKEFFPD